MEDNEEWKSPKYKSWVRGAKGLQYLQAGLKTFVGNKVVSQRDQVLQRIETSLTPGSAVTCNSCTSENLLPEHSIYNSSNKVHTCIQQKSRNCFGSNPKGRRVCPNGICGKLYDEIVDAHIFNDPLWKNTDPSTWCSDPEGWSYAKCFQTTLNPETCSSATDATGLLNIIINNKCFHGDVDCIQNFNSARDIRNDLLHCAKMELEETDLQSYLATFIAVLKDQKCLLHDQKAIQSVDKLEKLRNNQITISLSEEINLMQIRKDALSALDQLAKEENEVRKRIEESEQKALKKIEEAKSSLEYKEQEIYVRTETATSDMQNRKRDILTEIEGAGSELQSKKRKVLAEIETAKSEALETINADDVHKRLQSTQEAIEKLTAEVQQLKKSSNQRVEIGDRGMTHSVYSRDKTYTQMKNDMRRDLINFYRQQHDTIQLSPLNDEEDARLLDFYVKPDIRLIKLKRVHCRRKEEETLLDTFRNIFYKDEKSCHEIYVTADAGFGKTMFSKRLALAWCHDKDPVQDDKSLFLPEEVNAMKEFDFVFFVLLRDGSSECQIDDFIFSQLIFQRLKNNYCLSDLENILSNERCLVILDGLDEWAHPANDCTRKEKCIPHRRVRDNTVVLTTTRPWKLATSGIKDSQIDQKLEITGLGWLSAGRLIQSVISHLSGEKEADTTMVISFYSEIEANKLFDLQTIPILLMYMLCLFCDKMGLGNSLLGLYCNIVEMLLKRTVKKYKSTGIDLPQIPEYTQGDIPPCFRENKKCRKYYTLLNALGQLAYETLLPETNVKSMLVFDCRLVKQYLKKDWLNFCLKTGLLTKSKDREKLLEQQTKVSFGHKSIQEYFAALYMYSAPDVTSVPKKVLSECKSLSDIFKLSKILVFISGFNAEVSSLILAKLMKIVNKVETTCEYRSSADMIMDEVYELPQKEYQDICVSCFKEMPGENKASLCLQDVFIDYSCRRDQYCEILQHLITRNKQNIRSFCIDMNAMSETRYSSVRAVTDYFSLSGLENVEKVVFLGDYNDIDVLPLLNETIKCLHLCCGECSWSPLLMENVKNLQKLEALYICAIMMSHSELSEFYSYIQDISRSLRELVVAEIQCSDHIYSFCCDHEEDSTVTELDLSGYSKLRKLSLRLLSVGEIRVNIKSLQEFELVLGIKICSCNKNLNFVNNVPIDSKIPHTNVFLSDVNMSATTFRYLVDVGRNLQQTVHVLMRNCIIEPEEEFERVITEIKSSQEFNVLNEYWWWFEFETIKGRV